MTCLTGIIVWFRRLRSKLSGYSPDVQDVSLSMSAISVPSGSKSTAPRRQETDELPLREESFTDVTMSDEDFGYDLSVRKKTNGSNTSKFKKQSSQSQQPIVEPFPQPVQPGWFELDDSRDSLEDLVSEARIFNQPLPNSMQPQTTEQDQSDLQSAQQRQNNTVQEQEQIPQPLNIVENQFLPSIQTEHQVKTQRPSPLLSSFEAPSQNTEAITVASAKLPQIVNEDEHNDKNPLKKAAFAIQAENQLSYATSFQGQQNFPNEDQIAFSDEHFVENNADVSTTANHYEFHEPQVIKDSSEEFEMPIHQQDLSEKPFDDREQFVNNSQNSTSIQLSGERRDEFQSVDIVKSSKIDEVIERFPEYSSQGPTLEFSPRIQEEELKPRFQKVTVEEQVLAEPQIPFSFASIMHESTSQTTSTSSLGQFVDPKPLTQSEQTSLNHMATANTSTSQTFNSTSQQFLDAQSMSESSVRKLDEPTITSVQEKQNFEDVKLQVSSLNAAFATKNHQATQKHDETATKFEITAASQSAEVKQETVKKTVVLKTTSGRSSSLNSDIESKLNVQMLSFSRKTSNPGSSETKTSPLSKPQPGPTVQPSSFTLSQQTPSSISTNNAFSFQEPNQQQTFQPHQQQQQQQQFQPGQFDFSMHQPSEPTTRSSFQNFSVTETPTRFSSQPLSAAPTQTQQQSGSFVPRLAPPPNAPVVTTSAPIFDDFMDLSSAPIVDKIKRPNQGISSRPMMSPMSPGEKEGLLR